mgnify:CR=1 FL=1
MSIQRVIISGGGTGGHIFPAVAIADEIKRRKERQDFAREGSRGREEETKDVYYKFIETIKSFL